MGAPFKNQQNQSIFKAASALAAQTADYFVNTVINQEIVSKNTEKDSVGSILKDLDIPKEMKNVEEISVEDNETEDCNIDSELKKNKSDYLLAELLETEVTYVGHLEQICLSYLPLSKCLTKSQSLPLSSSTFATCKSRRPLSVFHMNPSYNLNTGEFANPVPRKKIKEMLGNIEDIKDYHKQVILPKLQEGINNHLMLRQLFVKEESRLRMKYGRYCMNMKRATEIFEDNKEFFTLYQINKSLSDRIESHLIMPVQRITRYHMFFKELTKEISNSGDEIARKSYTDTLESMLRVGAHTNNLLWVGKMTNCTLDLCLQGELLKHGQVLSRKPKERLIDKKWSCYLLLFQQTLILCKIKKGIGNEDHPPLEFFKSISVNHIQIMLGKNKNTFSIYKKEAPNENCTEEGNDPIMKIECKT